MKYPLLDGISRELAVLRSSNLYRDLDPVDFPIDFYSNDYLGITTQHLLVSHFEEVVEEYKLSGLTSSTGSRLLSGDSQFYHTLESYIAEYHQGDSALVFNSGYMANLSFFSTIPQKEDVVIYDQYIHASIRDGLRLGKANSVKFKHNDLEDLEIKLTKATKCYVAVEALYSMDGDRAPLAEIVKLCKKHNALLIVDEAHSGGVYGERGEGLVASNELQKEVFATIYTYGKAFGCHGASIVSNKLVKKYLINKARPFIYTTAMSELELAYIMSAYKVVVSADKLRSQLLSNVSYYRECFAKLPNRFKERLSLQDTPIQSLMVNGNESAQSLAIFFNKKGVGVKAIKSPTVPKGSERLRINLHAFNTKVEIDQLFEFYKEGIQN